MPGAADCPEGAKKFQGARPCSYFPHLWATSGVTHIQQCFDRHKRLMLLQTNREPNLNLLFVTLQHMKKSEYTIAKRNSTFSRYLYKWIL